MFLYEAFPPELINVESAAENKAEVFEELVDHFCQAEESDAREEILEVLWERESKMSTGIKKGVAVPHGRTNAVRDIHGILGISKRGIDYDALDGQPVYLIFMFLSPKTVTEEQLRLLKRLAELLNNPQFHTDLIAQNDSRSANRIIKKYEDNLFASVIDKT